MSYAKKVIRDFEAAQLLSGEERDLLPELVRFLPSEPAAGRETFSILDVGSGPTTRLGTRINGKRCATVTAIDQYADDYLSLLSERGLEVPVRPVQMRAEHAQYVFPPNNFDLIFLRNVLHEMTDPHVVVRSLVPLLRPGCSVVVYNVADERIAKYGCSPQWNVQMVDDNIVLHRHRRSAPLAPEMSGISARSFHQPSKAFAKLRIQRSGLNWREIRTEWELGKRETMLFWAERAANPEAFPGFSRRFDPELPLHDDIAKYLPAGDAPVSILDVGSGPATNIGYKVDGRRVDLTCVDVMAEPFNALLADAGLQAPVRPIVGDAERLSEQFEPASFDIVFSRNALDHVADPFSALTGMLAITRPGGCVIVWGHVNEGENEKYHGYHQWNFCWDDDFIIWRPGHRQRVSRLFDEDVHLTSEGSDKLYRIVIRRQEVSRSC